MNKWKDYKAQEAAQAAPFEPCTLEEFEQGAQEWVEILHAQFRERKNKEAVRIKDVLNCDYYFVVCFSNKDQLYEFCESVGLNPNEIYFDGRQFARKINRAIKTPDSDFGKIRFNKDYVKMAMEKRKTPD